VLPTNLYDVFGMGKQREMMYKFCNNAIAKRAATTVT